MLYVVKSKEVYQNMMRDIYAHKDMLKTINAVFEVEIKEHKKSKSRQQEKYFHSILKIICDFTGDDIVGMKRRITWSCDLKETFVTVDGEVIEVPKYTSDLNTDDYSKLIEASQMICVDLGLKFPYPDFYGLDI